MAGLDERVYDAKWYAAKFNGKAEVEPLPASDALKRLEWVQEMRALNRPETGIDRDYEKRETVRDYRQPISP